MYLIPQLRGDELAEYLRKSRKDDPLLTIEEVLEKHEQEISDWLEHNLPNAGSIPAENVFKEVVSGETIEGRPEMQRLLRLIESPKIKAIVCKEPSRLSRGDLMDIGYLVKILRYTGTYVFTTRGSYDLRDDRDREQFERELMRGNDYLEYQKKILKDGKLLAVKNGNYIGSYAPYGYKKVSYKENGRTCNTLEPVPEEAAVVKQIFDLYASGMGSVRICDRLDAEHVTPPRGKTWSTNTISSILNNVHYLGKVKYGHIQQGHRVEQGEIKRFKYTAEEYLLYDGKHPAIIDQELWDAVQRAKGKCPRVKKNAPLKNPLAGIIYCSCGISMAYKQVLKNGKPLGAPRIQCGNARCKENGSAKLSEVLDETIKVLQEYIADFEIKIEKGTDNSIELHRQMIERLEKRLNELRELEIKQWDEKTKGGMPDHVFERLNSQTVAEIKSISQTLCEAQNNVPQHVDLTEKITTFRAALELLRDPDAPPKEQNKLLRECIERVNYSRPRLPGFAGSAGNKEPFALEFTLRV